MIPLRRVDLVGALLPMLLGRRRRLHQRRRRRVRGRMSRGANSWVVAAFLGCSVAPLPTACLGPFLQHLSTQVGPVFYFLGGIFSRLASYTRFDFPYKVSNRGSVSFDTFFVD